MDHDDVRMAAGLDGNSLRERRRQADQVLRFHLDAVLLHPVERMRLAETFYQGVLLGPGSQVRFGHLDLFEKSAGAMTEWILNSSIAAIAPRPVFGE